MEGHEFSLSLHGMRIQQEVDSLQDEMKAPTIYQTGWLLDLQLLSF